MKSKKLSELCEWLCVCCEAQMRESLSTAFSVQSFLLPFAFLLKYSSYFYFKFMLKLFYSSCWTWKRKYIQVTPHCLIFFFNFTLFYFTILYWFCHTSTWIHHTCTRVPHPEPPCHLPPHTIPLGHPSAPAPSTLSHALNLDWRFISHMIMYMFQCHSPKPSHPCPLPQSPKDCSIHLCLFCSLAYRVIVTVFLNSIYMC